MFARRACRAEVAVMMGAQFDWRHRLLAPVSGDGAACEGQDRVLVLFGLFGAGNFGNKASLHSAVEAARRLAPDARVVSVCAVPEVVTAALGIDAEPIMMSRWEDPYARLPKAGRLLVRPLIEAARAREAARFLRGVDAVVVPGTGILDDFGVRPQQMPWDLFRWTLIAKFTKTPFSFVSVGAGPIEHPVSRWLMKQATRRASYRSFRDEVSRSYMIGLGAANPVDPITPDVVFGLSHPTPTPVSSGGRLRVGIGVMSFFGWGNDSRRGAATFERYLSSLVSLVDGLVQQGHSVRLLTGERSDEVAVERLLSELRLLPHAEGITANVVVEPITSLYELFEQIQLTDGVIATRYHNVIAALMMGRPTVSIGYADKNCEVMRGLGLEDHCYRVEEFEARIVQVDLEGLTRRWPELLPVVQERTRFWSQRVEQEYARVFGLGRTEKAGDTSGLPNRWRKGRTTCECS